jgi:hypothetical protein
MTGREAAAGSGSRVALVVAAWELILEKEKSMMMLVPSAGSWFGDGSTTLLVSFFNLLPLLSLCFSFFLKLSLSGFFVLLPLSGFLLSSLQRSWGSIYRAKGVAL